MPSPVRTPKSFCLFNKKFFGGSRGAVFQKSPPGRRRHLGFFAISGRPVRLKGVGILAPRVDKNGRFGLTYKMDARLKDELNVEGKYRGEVLNTDMMNKAVEEIVARWNEEHPKNKVKLKKKKLPEEGVEPSRG